MKPNHNWLMRIAFGAVLGVLLAGLATPQPVTATREPEPAKPTYTVKIYYQNGRIWVEFKDTEAHNFVVKARNADRGVGGWARMGKLHNDAKKKGAAIFPVPKSLDEFPRLSICLKDRSSDILICRMVIVP